jgi:hypothetical protein
MSLDGRNRVLAVVVLYCRDLSHGAARFVPKFSIDTDVARPLSPSSPSILHLSLTWMYRVKESLCPAWEEIMLLSERGVCRRYGDALG